MTPTPPTEAKCNPPLDYPFGLKCRVGVNGNYRESFTTSLTESVTKYKIEHGRRYHAFKEGSK